MAGKKRGRPTKAKAAAATPRRSPTPEREVTPDREVAPEDEVTTPDRSPGSLCIVTPGSSNEGNSPNHASTPVPSPVNSETSEVNEEEVDDTEVVDTEVDEEARRKKEEEDAEFLEALHAEDHNLAFKNPEATRQYYLQRKREDEGRKWRMTEEQMEAHAAITSQMPAPSLPPAKATHKTSDEAFQDAIRNRHFSPLIKDWADDTFDGKNDTFDFLYNPPFCAEPSFKPTQSDTLKSEAIKTSPIRSI